MDGWTEEKVSIYIPFQFCVTCSEQVFRSQPHFILYDRESILTQQVHESPSVFYLQTVGENV